MDSLWSVVWILVVLLLYIFLQWRIKRKERRCEYSRISTFLPQMLLYPQAADENSIYNISSRVQGQNQTQYPPDAYLSIDHITITNELNKPPKYDDAPPSYEEAIKLAQNNSLQTFETEQARHQVQPQTSSTSSSSATPSTGPVPVHGTRGTE